MNNNITRIMNSVMFAYETSTDMFKTFGKDYSRRMPFTTAVNEKLQGYQPITSVFLPT